MKLIDKNHVSLTKNELNQMLTWGNVALKNSMFWLVYERENTRIYNQAAKILECPLLENKPDYEEVETE